MSIDRPPAIPLSRREVLRAGSLGLAGLTLGQLLGARRAAAATSLVPRADACIVIFLNGGPSHLDMWDMKPDAPVEIRGEFHSIPTTVPGVQFSEHLPRLAGRMHRTTLVRSMHHSVNNSHAAAVYAALTGHDRGEQGGGAKRTDYPAIGSVMAKLRPSQRTSLDYITLPYKTKEGRGGPLQPGFLGGFMGAAYDPFWILEDPSAKDFHVPNLRLEVGMNAQRMTHRGRLLAGFDRLFRTQQQSPVMDSISSLQQQAFELLASSDAQRAFRLTDEPDSVRESYGKNIYGQSTLLARRLIEAGTRLVTLSWAPDANATWDTHGGNFVSLRDRLLPQFDAACSSLLDDLTERGMLDRTLVAVLGDFGRSPRINAGAGRDHWNNCYSIMLAGGGVRAGYVHGASDRTGALPAVDPTTPGDIIATIYTLLGISPDREIYDNLQRPFRLVQRGHVVRQLLA
jgi:hypothetical protein